MLTIYERIKATDHLPVHPRIYTAIMNLVASHALADLTTCLSHEPCLSLEFLKIANAESYGYRERITSLKSALLILDNELVKLILAQHPVLPALETLGRGVFKEYERIISHSLEVRLLIESLINVIPAGRLPIAAETLYAAATIHDVGRLYLLIYFPHEYLEALSLKRHPRLKKSRLPHHAVLGSLLCNKWNIPSAIQSAVAFHHCPWECLNNTGAELLYLADTASQTYYEYYYDQNDIYSFDELFMQRPQLAQICEKYQIGLGKLMEIRNCMPFKLEKALIQLGLA